MHQQWKDVTFLHWRVDPVRVAPLVPPGTRPLGTFAETNVRLYAVDRAGRRGVVFRSLDASRLPIVLSARMAFGLPYCWARMRVGHHDGDIEYATRRRWPGRGPRAAIRVRPEPVTVVDDPLAHFLTARWGLFTRLGNRSLYLPNEHATWPLQAATLQHLQDELVAAAGLPGVSDNRPDSVLFSAGVSTAFGVPTRSGGRVPT
jgi:uncharacterized protein YqjF (DUF2071 family)